MTPWVKRILIANVLVWLLLGPGLTGQGLLPIERLYGYFALVPAEVHLRPWTAFTYMFLHAPGLWHLFLNMLILFFFGSRLEAKVGGRQFLLLYLMAGVMGAILQVASVFLLGFMETNPFVPTVGASAAVLGVLYGFSRYWPQERVYLMLVIPVGARPLVLFFAGFSIFAGLTGVAPGIAHWAHLGGILGGFLFLLWRDRNTRAARFKRKVEGPTVRVVSGQDLERWKSVDPQRLHPLNRQEYERILGKVEERGADSLTPNERGFLDRFVRE